MDVVLLAVLVGIFVFIANSVAIFIVYRRLSKVFYQFIVPPEPGEPSAIASMAQSFAKVIAHETGSSITGSLMGYASGQSKQAQMIGSAIQEDAINQANPMMGAALSQFPALGKLLRKNPQLASMAAAMLAGHARPGNGNAGRSTGQVEFKL